MSLFTRSFPLEDISLRAGGDGRTVEAYAAVFNTETEIHDAHGHYREQIAPTAFNRTIANKGTNFTVLFNHGRKVSGESSDRGSMPIGTPLEVRADERGVYTLTRYLNNQLADEVLDAIRSNAIRSQSFAGRFVHSDPVKPPRRGYAPGPDGSLPLVTRTEIEMIEYGPAVFAAYDDASILGVRSQVCAQCAARFEISSDTPDVAASDLPINADSLSAEHSARHAHIQRNRQRLLLKEKGLL